MTEEKGIVYPSDMALGRAEIARLKAEVAKLTRERDAAEDESAECRALFAEVLFGGNQRRG